jgi:hypothetical protein
MVTYIPWSRLADFITGEEKYKTNVQTRFLKRPNRTGPPKEPRHNTGLYNYRYSYVLTSYPNDVVCSSTVVSY